MIFLVIFGLAGFCKLILVIMERADSHAETEGIDQDLASRFDANGNSTEAKP